MTFSLEGEKITLNKNDAPMNNKSKFNIIAGLAMIFLFVTSCDTEKEDVLEKGDEIQKVEIPSSDATNPIVAGQ